jgi:hypothetical protein
MRCRERPQLQFQQRLSLIHFCTSCSMWICNRSPGRWIADVGLQGFQITQRNGSTRNAGMRG